MRVLLVEDERISRQKVVRQVQQWGHDVTAVETGAQALEQLQLQHFDVVLTGWIMPGMTGLELTGFIRSRFRQDYVYVILLTSRDEASDVIEGLTAGADDCISKPFHPAELRARLQTAARILSLHQHLQSDLESAARYMKSMLPAPMTFPIAIDWRFLPCAGLSGDGFGYRWLDPDTLAVYVLDVAGHGIEAALLSATVMNMLRFQTLAETDFRRPAAVLAALNDVFQGETQSDRFFTAWYGVFDRKTRQLSWSGGGHPPAFLVQPADQSVQGLASQGPVVGAFPTEFAEDVLAIPDGCLLYLYSDGVHEIQRPDGTDWTIDEFQEFLRRHGALDRSLLDQLLAHVRSLCGRDDFDDDFTCLELSL